MASDQNIYATFNIGLDSKWAKLSLAGRLANINRAVALLAATGEGSSYRWWATCVALMSPSL